jgi:hypothetical protein
MAALVWLKFVFDRGMQYSGRLLRTYHGHSDWVTSRFVLIGHAASFTPY